MKTCKTALALFLVLCLLLSLSVSAFAMEGGEPESDSTPAAASSDAPVAVASAPAPPEAARPGGVDAGSSGSGEAAPVAEAVQEVSVVVSTPVAAAPAEAPAAAPVLGAAPAASESTSPMRSAPAAALGSGAAVENEYNTGAVLAANTDSGSSAPAATDGEPANVEQQSGEEPKNVTAEWAGRNENTPASLYPVVPENLFLQQVFSGEEVDVNNGYIFINGGTVAENNGVVQGVGLGWSSTFVNTNQELADPLISPNISPNNDELIFTTSYGTVVTNNGLIGNYQTSTDGNTMTLGQAASIYTQRTGWEMEYGNTLLVVTDDGIHTAHKEEDERTGKYYTVIDGLFNADESETVLVKERSPLYQGGSIVYDESGNPVPDPNNGNIQIVVTNTPGGVISSNGIGFLEPGGAAGATGVLFKPFAVALPGYVITNEGTILRNAYGEYHSNNSDIEGGAIVVTNAATGTIDVNEGIVGAHAVDQNRNPLYDEDGKLIPGNTDVAIIRGCNQDGEMILYVRGDDGLLTKLDPSDLMSHAVYDVTADATGNFGTIGVNTETGIVILNQEGGVIGTNSGTVYANNGEITENAGTVGKNLEGGTVDNAGEVKENAGDVTNKDGGVVEENAGEVNNENGGTVEKNSEGEHRKRRRGQPRGRPCYRQQGRSL